MNRNDNPDRMADTGPKELVRWADRAQYHSDAMPDANRAPGGGSRPTVTLLNAMPDPLGSLAALCGIYEGKVVRRLADISDDDRRAAWEAMRATVLNGPLESITFHFLVEGATRAFTHQAVRNRFSFFAQESMRFAVVDDEPWVDRQAYPPSLAREPERLVDPERDPREWMREHSSPEEHDYALRREAWDDAIIAAQDAYKRLVAAGVPAEEARGLMPHSMTTRYHWVVNVRALLDEAGKRLCTQAQFEWRQVMAQVVKALRNKAAKVSEDESFHDWPHTGWQFELMADALQPVCYQEGRCGFMAKFDRGCTIRERVNANASINRPSSEWHKAWLDEEDEYAEHATGRCGDPDCSLGESVRRLLPIQPKEWLADPAAARVV